MENAFEGNIYMEMEKVKQLKNQQYYSICREDEYHEIQIDSGESAVEVNLPYANDFRQIKITKASGDFPVHVIPRGLDKISNRQEKITLENVEDSILLESDNEECWIVKERNIKLSMNLDLGSDQIITKEDLPGLYSVKSLNKNEESLECEPNIVSKTISFETIVERTAIVILGIAAVAYLIFS